MIYIGNWRLLFEAIEYALTHPDEYNQGTWRRVRDCGTTVRCIGGWIAHLAGYADSPDIDYVIALSMEEHGVYGDGDIEVDRAALNALQLNPRVWPPDSFAEAQFCDALFGPHLSMDTILELVAGLAEHDEAGLTPLIKEEMAARGLTAKEFSWT